MWFICSTPAERLRQGRGANPAGTRAGGALQQGLSTQSGKASVRRCWPANQRQHNGAGLKGSFKQERLHRNPARCRAWASRWRRKNGPKVARIGPARELRSGEQQQWQQGPVRRPAGNGSLAATEGGTRSGAGPACRGARPQEGQADQLGRCSPAGGQRRHHRRRR